MNTTTTILSIDKTFESFLTAVYTGFHEELDIIEIRLSEEKNALLFNQPRHIAADREKARWVWDWLYNKGTADLRLVYFAFLSEKEEVLLPLLEFTRLLFLCKGPEFSNRLSVLRRKLVPWAERVDSEKQKLETHLKIKSRQGEFNGCSFRPVYDILPLLTRYCREHFGPDPWVLVDAKRNYGLRKNGEGVECFRLPVGSSGLSGTTMQPHSPGVSTHTLEPLQEAV
jgi:probable DNA metabolism protein